MTSREHAGKALISITDGVRVGEIKDLYLDADARGVVGVFLGTESLINRKPRVIPRSAVRVFGVDVWLVDGPNCVGGADAIPCLKDLPLASDLRGREVHSEGGTRLAVVEDIVVDSGGRIVAFALGKVFAKGPLEDRKLIERAAITHLGSKKDPMTTLLSQAETRSLPVE